MGSGRIPHQQLENYFAIFKRGMKGVYQHCSERPLHRYLAEFDHRYSNRIGAGVDDTERATRALKGGLPIKQLVGTDPIQGLRCCASQEARGANCSA
jgi:ISXO2-like transposase domain